MIPIALAVLPRLALVMLFFPFSAWDKVTNFRAAVAQARGIGVGARLGAAMIVTGLAVEVICSLCVLTGLADRPAAFLLGGYCVLTALLYKRWWTMAGGIFDPGPNPRRRETFFDFWKNLAVAGGFALIAFGTTADGVRAALDAPFSSTRPYATAGPLRSPQFAQSDWSQRTRSGFLPSTSTLWAS